jgi:hypothetical protein
MSDVTLENMCRAMPPPLLMEDAIICLKKNQIAMIL